MHKLSLETEVIFALTVFKSLKDDSSFDDIISQLDERIQASGKDFKRSDVILLMKYIGYYELLNHNSVPTYFIKNNKKPISSDKGTVIKGLIADFDLDSASVGKETVSVQEISRNIVQSYDKEKNLQIPSIQSTAASNETEKIENVYLDSLSNEKLELVLSNISAANFSVRLGNVLDYLKIKKIGQILFHKNLKLLGLMGKKSPLRGYGENSLLELKSFLKQNGLEKISLFEWPTAQEIKNLIATREIIVGKYFSMRSTLGSPETENVYLQGLSNEKLKLALINISAANFSVRLGNVLGSLQIEKVGQILLSENLKLLGLTGKKSRVPNYGRNSLLELKSFLKQHSLENICLIEWPTTEKIENLIENRGLILDLGFSGIGNVHLERLTNEELELVLSNISAANFSARLGNVLGSLQIEKVGQILLSENLKLLIFAGRESRLPNYGRNSLLELKSFLKQHSLENICLIEWPTTEKIDNLIETRGVVVGKCFALITEAATIEGEAKEVFDAIVSDDHRDGIFRRLGLDDDCIQWTLQEVANIGFKNGAVITRERVRQIQERYIKKLKDAYFLAPKCKEVASYIGTFPFISEALLNEYLLEKKFTNASDPISLLTRLREYGFCNHTHKIIEVRLFNSRFLVKEEYSKSFDKFAKACRKRMYGRIFLDLSLVLTEAVPEEERKDFYKCLLKNLNYLKNVVVCRQDKEIFIARRAFRLGSHGIGKNGLRTNTLVSIMTLIFSICSVVNLRVMHQAITRDRKMREQISFEFFTAYLKACPFLKIDGEKVICLNRPKYDGKISNDYKVIDTALDIGSATFTSTQLIKGLVEKGLSTNAARVMSNISPFLVHLKKGNFRTPGIFRLICELEDLDIINYREEGGLLNNVLDGVQKFKIPNNPPLRVTGRAVVPELEINEGEYQVYDEEDNYLLDIEVRGKMILGLKILASKEPNSELKLSFSDGRFLYS
jgi:hypothetical protein